MTRQQGAPGTVSVSFRGGAHMSFYAPPLTASRLLRPLAKVSVDERRQYPQRVRSFQLPLARVVRLQTIAWLPEAILPVHKVRVVRPTLDISSSGHGNSRFDFGVYVSVCGCMAACLILVARGPSP
jgi:hypothetical protein